jgi:membrane associated rhomboid family serine protease
MLALPLYDDTPRGRPPIITYGLIAACCLVFLWQAGLSEREAEEATVAFGMIPAVLFGGVALPARLQIVPGWATVFTSMFLHGSLLHLGGNMIYLWIFGKGAETALGAFRFLFFYLICGAAAALTQAAINPASEVPMIGASGAIAGALGGYIILYPRANVVLFVWIIIIVRLIAVPAPILLGLWFLLQLISALSAPAGTPGVAFWAHVGGFIIGILLVALFRPRGVGMLQPARTASFSMAHPRDVDVRRWRGSVPGAGRPRGRPRDPWG